MNKTNLLLKVKNAVKATLNNEVDEENITIDSKLIQDLNFDSLKVAILSVHLENEFNQAVILDNLLRDIDDPLDLTVAKLCEYLEKNLDFESIRENETVGA